MRVIVRVHLLQFQNLGNLIYHTLPVFFGGDTKSCWSILPGVYARGSKRTHTGKWKNLLWTHRVFLIYKVPHGCRISCCQNTWSDNGVSAVSLLSRWILALYEATRYYWYYYISHCALSYLFLAFVCVFINVNYLQKKYCSVLLEIIADIELTFHDFIKTI